MSWSEGGDDEGGGSGSMAATAAGEGGWQKDGLTSPPLDENKTCYQGDERKMMTVGDDIPPTRPLSCKTSNPAERTG